jgi:acyl-coenzyme A thioesterase PaaI-like protein
MAGVDRPRPGVSEISLNGPVSVDSEVEVKSGSGLEAGSAERVADELRTAIRALSELEIPLANIERARELAVALNGELVGPRARRWYEGDSSAHAPSQESQGSFLHQSPVRGRRNAIAPPLVVDPPSVTAEGRRVVRGRATLGTAYEGPPHGVHGGWVSALFDELLGTAQQLLNQAGVTATLSVRYRDITPLDEELRFEAWIHEDRGRRVVARATCHAGDTLTADAEALFVRVDFGEIQGRMRKRREARPA